MLCLRQAMRSFITFFTSFLLTCNVCMFVRVESCNWILNQLSLTDWAEIWYTRLFWMTMHFFFLGQLNKSLFLKSFFNINLFIRVSSLNVDRSHNMDHSNISVDGVNIEAKLAAYDAPAPLPSASRIQRSYLCECVSGRHFKISVKFDVIFRYVL